MEIAGADLQDPEDVQKYKKLSSLCRKNTWRSCRGRHVQILQVHMLQVDVAGAV